MIIRRFVAVSVLLMASLGLVGTPSAQAACTDRGVNPLPELKAGERSFELLDTEAEAGGSIRFKVGGFVRDAGGGQTLNFKLNDVDPTLAASQSKADDLGNLEGTVTLPSAEEFRGLAKCGAKKWWVRVLVGAGAENDMPAASYYREFTLTTDLGDTTPDPSSSPSAVPSTSTTTTPTTTSTTPTSSGTLPKTGIEDHGVLLVTSGLALAALLALFLDRRLRRRRTAESA